jgi:hemerythrin-like domain-containing protein/uncharacterized protein (DUF2249 family)
VTSRPGAGSTSRHLRNLAEPREATDTRVDEADGGDDPRSLDHLTRSSRSSQSDKPSQRLGAEHELLLRAVIARADHVLAALAAGRWPWHELTELIRYLQTEVIRQTRMEEQFLFVRTGGPSDAEFTRLAHDHVTIRCALEALTDAARDRDQGDQGLLNATVRDLVAQLAQHLRQEQAVLSRHATDMSWQRALAEMERNPHAWYPLRQAPVLDLNAFSTSQVFDVVRARVQRLGPDEQAVLVSGRDLRLLCEYLLRDEDVAVHYLDDGPQTWRVSVRRRGLQ